MTFWRQLIHHKQGRHKDACESKQTAECLSMQSPFQLSCQVAVNGLKNVKREHMQAKLHHQTLRGKCASSDDNAKNLKVNDAKKKRKSNGPD